MRFAFLFSFSIFFGIVSPARVIPIQDRVDSALLTHDFISFKTFADNLSKSEGNLTSYWERFRELVKGYNEGIFYFEKSVPDKDNPGVSSVYTYRVTMTTTDSVIISFDLSEKLNRKNKDGEWEPYYNSLDSYKNESLFALLQSSFKSVFGTTLKEAELFDESMVYGGNCGYAGIMRPERRELDKMVSDNDRKGLTEWLQSTNVEKQVYAVDGFYQLKQKGIPVSPEEKRMIEAVMKKKGTIRTCSGCIYGEREISEIVRKFHF